MGFLTKIALFPKWHATHLKHRSAGRLEKLLVDTGPAEAATEYTPRSSGEWKGSAPKRIENSSFACCIEEKNIGVQNLSAHGKGLFSLKLRINVHFCKEPFNSTEASVTEVTSTAVFITL